MRQLQSFSFKVQSKLTINHKWGLDITKNNKINIFMHSTVDNRYFYELIHTIVILLKFFLNLSSKWYDSEGSITRSFCNFFERGVTYRYIRTLFTILMFVLMAAYVALNYSTNFDINKALEKVNNLSLIESVIEQEPLEQRNYYDLEDGITDEARRYMKELGLVNPGGNSEPIILSQNISLEIRKLMNESIEEFGFNAFLSNMISLNRNVTDFRSDICKNKVYNKNLPKCSIIIVVHNEDWMLFMRTIHSVLLRSPPELIEEILIIDDASDKEWLHKRLDEYIKKLPKVRIIRSFVRIGIIGARNLGSLNAIGPILVSLDSHVEVGPGWLEPLLDRFVDNKKRLVCTKLTGINKETFKPGFGSSAANSINAMNWRLDMNW
ncbi:CLUMA_CG013634, isoform A [Clunio marinus]|uniref:CLUMA_CG013634, isoform A n=1 Tax=Clunio marinus TaxID=568069 RepID=A0A1J1IJF7_9DIPT|nr:CLUMA_CG013634, isoform A [Clunio marinus]